MARAAAREYADQGARAVVLSGSWARGDAHRASDIDLWVLGNRRSAPTLWRERFMVCVTRTTEAAERRRLSEPPYFAAAVPGWQVAIPLFDPHGIARQLKAEARCFRWESVARKADRWVASSMVGWAEEAVKLVRAMAEGELQTASVQRNLLANALASVMAIHRRMLWRSENGFWERVSSEVGGRWGSAQRRALGNGAGLRESLRSALLLYHETARATWECLDAQQRSVVAFACDVIGEPLVGGRGRSSRRGLSSAPS